MKFIKTLLPAVAIVAAGAVAVPAFAHPEDCFGGNQRMGERGPKGGERMQERMKMRQQQLYDALKLTPAQEKAWEAFQQSHPAANGVQRPDPAEFAKLPAPERAEKMLENMKQHEAAMGKHVAAMRAFYDQLSPEQKKVFDEQFMQRPQRGMRGGPRGNPQPPAPPAAQ